MTLQRERQRVLTALGELVPPEWAHEVGSTAVDGLIGKQDLDFLVLTPANAFAATRETLDEHYERNPVQLSSEVYQGYTVQSELDVAIQLTVAGGPHDTFLDFLQKLQTDTGLRASYNALKRRYDGEPMADYREAKSAFIKAALNGST